MNAPKWLQNKAERFYRAVGFDVAEQMAKHDNEFKISDSHTQPQPPLDSRRHNSPNTKGNP